MFKLNQLLLAVAGTLVAGQVMAAPVTQANITTARNAGTLQESWISGASAPTFNVFQGFATGCDADTLSTFNGGSATAVAKPGASSAGNFLAYACTRGGVVSVLYHTIDGGSFNAYAPHIPNDVDGDGTVGTTNLRRLRNLNSTANTTCVAQTGTFSLPNQSAIPGYRSCGVVTPATTPDGATAKPAGGFSDVEAALFGVSTSGFGTESDALVGQVFGVATSVPLYRALQAAQGIYASEAAAAAADPDFLPGNAPSLSRAQYTSIIVGNFQDWTSLIPGSTKKVNLARRVPTSGTQGSSNAFFLRNPCNGDPGILGALQPVKASDSTANFVVTEGSGTGNVKTALTSNTEFAIGVMSLENNWRTESAGSSAGYRFVKIDGIHPEAPVAGSGTTYDEHARYSAAQGNYDFHIELKAFVADSADGFGAQVIDSIKNAFAGLSCSDLPRGLTLNPLSGSSCTVGEVVAKGTRFGNNCQAQQLLF